MKETEPEKQLEEETDASEAQHDPHSGEAAQTPREDYLFVDLVKVGVPCLHRRTVGTVRTETDLGTGDIFNQKVVATSVTGPGGGDCMVRSLDHPSNRYVEMRTCPGKYLQGHNAWGPVDLKAFVADLSVQVLNELGLNPTSSELEAVQEGNLELYELDLTAMVDLGEHEAVRDLLDRTEAGVHSKLGRPRRYKHTVVFGEKSYYSLKFYDKCSEMARSEPNTTHRADTARQAARDWTRGKIRVEMHIRRKKLRRLGLTKVSDWTPERMASILRKALAQVSISGRSSLPDEVEKSLTPAERRAYRHWKAGEDLTTLYSRNQLRKLRERFHQLGVELDLEPSEQQPEKWKPRDKITTSDLPNLEFSTPPDINVISTNNQ